MNAYKKYLTIDQNQQITLANLPFQPGQKVEIIILTTEDQEIISSDNSDHIILENIENDPFVGMWQDREDLKDSGQWVRQVRREEWG